MRGCELGVGWVGGWVGGLTQGGHGCSCAARAREEGEGEGCCCCLYCLLLELLGACERRLGRSSSLFDWVWWVLVGGWVGGWVGG